MRDLLKPVGFAVGAALILIVLGRIAIFAAAPIGGGVYHLVFAYSEGGRLGSAVYVYLVYLLTFGGLTAALLALDYPLDWRVLFVIASGLAVMHWWGIVQWSPSSTQFHRMVVVLLPLLPLGIWAVTLPVLRRQRTIAPLRASRPRT